MRVLPSPNKKEETARELTPGVIVANGVPAGAILSIPPFASSFRNPLPWTSISHLCLRAGVWDWADKNCAANRQHKRAAFLKNLLIRMPLFWRIRNDKE